VAVRVAAWCAAIAMRPVRTGFRAWCSISKRQLDEAEAELSVAQRTAEAARRRSGGWRATGGHGFDLRSPIDGLVAFAAVVPGRVVGEGTPLLTIVDPGRLWAIARVFESDARKIVGTSGMEISVSGRDEPIVLDASHGAEVVAVGSAIDSRTRTVEVVVGFDKPYSRKSSIMNNYFCSKNKKYFFT